MRSEVKWAARNPVPQPKGWIDRLGGENEIGMPWENSGIDVRYNIDQKRESYYIVVDGREVDLVVRSDDEDRRYLATTADTDTRALLWELPNPWDPNQK